MLFIPHRPSPSFIPLPHLQLGQNSPLLVNLGFVQPRRLLVVPYFNTNPPLWAPSCFLSRPLIFPGLGGDRVIAQQQIRPGRGPGTPRLIWRIDWHLSQQTSHARPNLEPFHLHPVFSRPDRRLNLRFAFLSHNSCSASASRPTLVLFSALGVSAPRPVRPSTTTNTRRKRSPSKVEEPVQRLSKGSSIAGPRFPTQTSLPDSQ